MKPQTLCILCLAFNTLLRAETPDIDTELTGLAQKLGAAVKENGKKKVTVLDFTDLEGQTSELGRYIAEQLTVDLVMNRKDFAVLDRANLKSILAEHKLTATGLVEPENAKKLGMFSGVDALVLGTIVPKGSIISVTAKIITTDTAEIVGATKTAFNADTNVQQLLSHVAKLEVPLGNPSTPSTPPVARKLFGDLKAEVESFRLSTTPGAYGFGTLTLNVTNTSPTDTYGLAFDQDVYRNIDFRNSREEWFQVSDLSGISRGFWRDDRFYGSFTDIPPSSAIRVVAKTQVGWNGKPGDYRPYRFQTVVFFAKESNGQYVDARNYNLIIDIK